MLNSHIYHCRFLCQTVRLLTIVLVAAIGFAIAQRAIALESTNITRNLRD
ncbi:MAG: hypothetical protein F6K58_10005 [Symploca sp. SIO2E9]|nr:hypothetical protein [Symploca sp. SIO2E9]